MCMPEAGTRDAMSPQEQYRYKEAMGELSIPQPAVVAKRDDSYVAPKGATVRMPDGKMITKEAHDKLMQKLKNRGV
jgi:hypothetical protein